jgi:hypothetical protein
MTMRIVVVVLLCALTACGGGRGRSGGPAGGPAPVWTAPAPVWTAPAPGPASVRPLPGGRVTRRPGAHTVTFAIRGDARRVSVTYTTPAGRHRTVVSPPWSMTFTVEDGQGVDVGAHSTGGGELTCTLKVDGELLKSATSSGDSATVDCGDSIGF